MIKAIIIDDENRARQLLQAMLSDLCPEVKIEALCFDLASGVKAIKQYKPNLVFLDIEMPGHSGLHILDFLLEEEITFDLIFVTAYNEYAINAFKLEAIDYLLKPLDSDQLVAAVNRVVKSQRKDYQSYQLLKHRFGSQKNEKLAIAQLDGIKLIDYNEILYLEGDGAYTHIHCKQGQVYVASKNLKYFEGILIAHSLFFRCHKSYIVNTYYIESVVKGDRPMLRIQTKELAVSVEKIDSLLLKIKS